MYLVLVVASNLRIPESSNCGIRYELEVSCTRIVLLLASAKVRLRFHSLIMDVYTTFITIVVPLLSIYQATAASIFEIRQIICMLLMRMRHVSISLIQGNSMITVTLEIIFKT